MARYREIRASAVFAGILLIVVIGAGWTLIQTVAAHIPLKQESLCLDAT
jgi:hypothetical protein